MTPEEIDAAVKATDTHGIILSDDGEWSCECKKLIIEDRRDWYRHQVEVELLAAEEARLASGEESVGYGRKTDGSDLIYPVANTEYGRRLATHTRRVVVWPEEGPNNNWARHNGPWVQIGGPFS